MSITCSKTFSLTINSVAKTPFAYYKFDSKTTNGFGFDTTPEIATAAWDALNTNAHATLISGKIGNGWTHSGSVGCAAPGLPFNFDGRSFLIRFWARCIGTVASWAFDFMNFSDNGFSGEAYHFQIYPWWTSLNFPPDNFKPVIWWHDIGGDVINVSSYSLDATWKRVIIYNNVTDGEAGVVVDNNPADTVIIPFGLLPCANRWDLGGVNSKFEFDELGFWADADAEWTAADFAYDWNGGAGRTYP